MGKGEVVVTAVVVVPVSGSDREHVEDLGNFHLFLTIPRKLCCDYAELHVKNSPAADAN